VAAARCNHAARPPIRHGRARHTPARDRGVGDQRQAFSGAVVDIEPHIPVFDKSQRTDGTFSREDFTYDHSSDTYRCPAGETLSTIVGGSRHRGPA
jgi:hypothetical protein